MTNMKLVHDGQGKGNHDSNPLGKKKRTQAKGPVFYLF
jgi:hypothetical protein